MGFVAQKDFAFFLSPSLSIMIHLHLLYY